MRHAHQKEQLNNQDSVAGFEMAHKQLFIKYLNTSDYDSYHQNYRYSKIELDAEKMGYYNASLFFHSMNCYELEVELRKSQEENLSKRNYYHFMYDSRKVPISIDKFIVENLDKIIKEHPEELNKYQVLTRFYNNNGTRKSFINILNQRLNGVEYKEMLEYYLNYGIRQDELSNKEKKDSNNLLI